MGRSYRQEEGRPDDEFENTLTNSQKAEDFVAEALEMLFIALGKKNVSFSEYAIQTGEVINDNDSRKKELGKVDYEFHADGMITLVEIKTLEEQRTDRKKVKFNKCSIHRANIKTYVDQNAFLFLCSIDYGWLFLPDGVKKLCSNFDSQWKDMENIGSEIEVMINIIKEKMESEGKEFKEYRDEYWPKEFGLEKQIRMRMEVLEQKIITGNWLEGDKEKMDGLKTKLNALSKFIGDGPLGPKDCSRILPELLEDYIARGLIIEYKWSDYQNIQTYLTSNKREIFEKKSIKNVPKNIPKTPTKEELEQSKMVDGFINKRLAAKEL